MPTAKHTPQFAVYWWAYRHTNGTIQLKRYLGIEDFADADESPFVAHRTDRFLASDRAEAMAKAEEMLANP